MSEGMTPERRAEIESVLAGIVENYEFDARYDHERNALTELLAEIDRLNKVVDQAIEISDFQVGTHTNGVWSGNSANEIVYDCPELAAELARRGK